MALVVVFLGATFVAAQAPNGGTVLVVDVPLGQITQRVTYEVHERSGPDAEWAPVAPQTFVVDAAGRVVDALGRSREAVQVMWVPDEESGSPVGVAVDLHTREVLRHDTWRADRPNWTFVSTDGVTGTERYAIHSTYDWSPGITARLAVGSTMLWMQGERLRVGDDWTAQTEQAFRALLGPRDGALLEAFRFEVTGAGRLGDDAVVAVRLQARVAAPAQQVSVLGEGGASPLLFVRTTWYAASSAYPLMEEDVVHSGAGAEAHTLRVLAAVEGEGPPVPWGPWRMPADVGPADAPEMTPDGMPHPGPGVPPARCLPLQQVLERLAADPAHADLRAWRSVHTPNHLVGIRAECRGDNARWWILFATPDGEAFGALVETGQGAGEPSPDPGWGLRQRDRVGPLATLPFDAAQIPERFVTLAHATRHWERFTSGVPAAEEPGSVRWGHVFAAATWPDAHGDVADWSTIELSLFRAEVDDQGELFTSSRVLSVDAVTGGVLSSEQTAYRDVAVGPADLVQRVGGSAPARPAAASASSPMTMDIPLVVAIATGGLLAALVITYVVSLLKFASGQSWPVFSGYAKIRRERLLDNDLRAHLLRRIQEEPGLTATEVARDLDAGWSTIIYHLRVLERSGYIASSADTRHRRFFAAQDVPLDQRQRLAVLRNPRTRDVLDLVRAEPGISLGVLAVRLGVTAPGVAWHVRRLESQALVVRRKVGRTVRVEPAAP